MFFILAMIMNGISNSISAKSLKEISAETDIKI